MYSFKPKGVCATQIDFDIQDGTVKNVVYKNGCSGSLKGIGMLVEGMKVEDVINRLKGTQCGAKSTSCPDQLAAALTSYLNERR